MGFLTSILDYLMANPSLLVAGVLVYVFIFALSVFFSGPKPGLNPFRMSTCRNPEELVTDQTARDKVLKQGFVAKKLPPKIDAIVVGSGIGGLTTACLLARSRKRVVVLEQHDQAGGCCHTFIEKGYEFDVGIHYIGEMRNNTLLRGLMDELTNGQLQWNDLDDPFDTVALGEPGKARLIPHYAGKDQWRAKMLEQFPDEEKAIDRYLQLLKELSGSVMGGISVKIMPKWFVRFLISTRIIHLYTKYFSYSQRSLTDVLDEITTNNDLKACLGYSFGDYGTLPRDSSFAMHAMLINHYMYGSSYPVGGASEIAFHMIPTIEKAGGRVFVRAKVSQILTDVNGKACGVRVHKPGGDIDVMAPLVISDAGVVNTFKTLLPKEIACKSDMYSLLESGRIKSGIAGMSLFVGLKGSKEELGLKAHNIWAFTGNDIDQVARDYFALSAEEAMTAEVPLMFVSFPSAKDPTWPEREPGKSTCTIVTLSNWEWFSEWEGERVKQRGGDYDRVKNAIAERMWEQTLALYPQLKDKVEYFDSGTPISNKYYIASACGEFYGLDHNIQRFSAEVMHQLRPETDIPGLYLTGQDIFTCGLAGGLFGGVLSAAKILNRNLITDIVKLKKHLKKAQ